MENVANAKILTETGRASKALITAGDSLLKVMSGISVFTQEVDSLVEQIDIKTGELSQLDSIYNDKVRQHKIDLKFKIQENEEEELQNILNARGLIATSANHVDELETQIATLTTNQEKLVTTEVTKAVNAVKAETANTIKFKELEHSTATAKLNADLEALQSKVKYLEGALATANKSLDDERAARIEIAAKTAQPSIVVNGK